MRKMRFTGFLFLLLFTSFRSFGQTELSFNLDNLYDIPDSAEVFAFDEFMRLTFDYHPVIKQGRLLSARGEQEIRMARGTLDPKLEANWDVKNFEDKEYFNVFNSTLKIPTWFPVDPKVSARRNRGVFLNPERFIPEDTDNWQFQLGVELPVGRGLFIDPRRAAVRQSIEIRDMLEADRIKTINKVLLEASKAYWNWYAAYYQYILIQQNIEITREIFDRTKLNFEFGEASVIDTLQASITLQNRLINLREARVNLITNRLLLSNFLWTIDEEPLELTSSAVPVIDNSIDAINVQYLDSLRTTAISAHPELLKLNSKLNQLNIKNRLARENLKPVLNLQYNFINQPLNPNGDFTNFTFSDNYKFGVEFAYPLLIRKERAKAQFSKIEIQETDYELDLRSRQILNNLEATYAESINTLSMIEQQRAAVNSYQSLLNAELLNLELGESDLFKINFQQDKLIESQTKLIDLEAKNIKLLLMLRWASGVEYLDLENLLTN